ncbi:MAG TPA: winged helix DNA-binding domain-containing protein [Actinomycetota bacterium]|nr:winged helix DNA-binding domain-containing protein [Actinomycetota bacterium]
MADADVLTDERLRRRRVAAQLLHRPRHSSPSALVRHLAGVQAQVLSAAALALRARSEALTPARVDRARTRDRSIVLCWAMRGTLHLVAAEDHGWLVPLTTEPRITNAHRRLRQEGVPAGDVERAVRLIGSELDRDGPLLRAELAERLERRGIRTKGQAIAHLVWLACARGVACHGPDRDDQPAFVRTGDWLGRTKPNPPEDALAELAVRYLRAHAPATPADLAAWSGIRAGDAKRAWRAIDRRLVERATDRGPMWSLRGTRAAEPEGVVRLLPAFDEFLLGWTQRDLIASATDWQRINRGGGWLHPVVLHDGRALGTWARGRDEVRVRGFHRLPPDLGPAIAGESKEIAAFRAGGRTGGR